MKKLIAVLLALVLVSNLTMVGLLIQNNRLLKKAVSNGGLSVGTHGTVNRPEITGEQIELMRVTEDKYLEPSGDWHFNFEIRNTTETDLFINSLTFIDNHEYTDCRDIYSDPMLFETMLGPDFAEKSIAPGEVFSWGDGHPGEHLTHRIYLFSFVGADGNEYTAEFEYNLFMEVGEGAAAGGVDYSTDKGHDLLTLRHEADFEVPVADGVYWIPVRALGESRFSNEEIYAMLREKPEAKQEEIHTLYEALQLYQVGGFYSSDDNIRVQENGIEWEHHKPGYHAVLTNNGCCATSANWLNYILKNDYDEVGFVATSQRDGSGHIFNYIRHDGWYYFIDLTHYRTDWIATAEESGNQDDYYSTDFILGNLHKTKTVESYVKYIQDTFGDPPGLMFQYTADNCLAIDSVRDGDSICIVYEDNPDVDLAVIFDDPGDKLEHRLEQPPTDIPQWD